ncbi:MAG: CHAT domain-containing protein [Chloroflexi bacterium]|nr:CHAT domain-containing protein [Chloroflexota bacterium]
MNWAERLIAARQISGTAPDFSRAISRLIEQTPRAQRAELIATLERDARATLDQQPRAARDWARVAYELARASADARVQAETTLTFAIALNRLGDFRQALPVCHQAATLFEQCGETENAARALCESAWAKTFIGDLDSALENVQRARQFGPTPLSQARCDWVQARVLRSQAHYPEAETLLGNARNTFEASQLFLQAARCERELAHTYIFMEREHLTRLRQASEIFSQAQCALDETLCAFYIAISLLQSGQHRQAIQSHEQCRTRFLACGANYFAGLCNIELGIGHRHLNQFDQAFVYLHQARAYFLAHTIQGEVSACDINLGNLCYSLNRYDEALSYYQEAAALALSEKRESRAARIFTNLALVYTKQGRFAHALDLHQRARQVFESKNLAERVAFCDTNLAAVYCQLGQFDPAVEHLQRAIAVFAEQHLDEYLAECLMNLADAHLARGECAPAIQHLEHARALCATHAFDSLGAVCARLLAQVAAQQGNRQKALTRVQQARATFLKHNQRVDAALCDLTEGEIVLDDPRVARDYFDRAREILAPAFPDHAWRADYGLGRCARANQDDTAALANYLDAVRAIADVRAAVGVEQFSNDFFAQRQAVYADALQLAVERNNADAALEIIEASKARAFLALIQQRGWHARRDGNDRYVTELIAREQKLRNDLQALRQRVAVQTAPELGEPLRGITSASAMSEATRGELNALSAHYEAVVAQLRVATRGLAGAPAPAPFALADFRAAMRGAFGDDWRALDYAWSENQIVIVVVSPLDTRLICKQLTAYDRKILEQCAAVEPDLRERIYRGTVRGARVPFSDKPLRQLYHLLIPPNLDASTLILAPHRALHNLPFHALRDDAGYLIEKHAVVYTPSFQILASLQTALPEGLIENSALVCGLATFDADLSALPYAETEVNDLRASFEPGKFLWGADATRQTLLELNDAGALQKLDVLHFATHALLDRAAPHQSRIVLSDAPLTTFDILDLTLNARLVTLSACQTALGKGGDGDELIGLARAFFYAGARALLATLWHVEDDSTADAVRRVYQHRAHGENLATALRHAQIEMIRAGRSPYQWAPFVLMGQP